MIPSIFTPHLQLASVLELEVTYLKALRLRGLLLDMDGTLKDHRAPKVPPPVTDWLQTTQAAGIRLCLVSNGQTRRIEGLARTLQLPFVAQAFKPLPIGCFAALKTLGLPRFEVAMIGDQVFADVLAGRLAGLFTILVAPTSRDEPWFTRLKRPLESRLLRGLKLRSSTLDLQASIDTRRDCS